VQPSGCDDAIIAVIGRGGDGQITKKSCITLSLTVK
jgi:hypothetical protein